MDALFATLTNESRWILPSALIAIATSLAAGRGRTWDRPRIAGAAAVFSGLWIGLLAVGHLVAVTMKLTAGTLAGPRPVLYAIGLALLVPAFWVLRNGLDVLQGRAEPGRQTAFRLLVLAIAILATGPRNLPLAVPSLLSAAYAIHRRRVMGAAIALALVIVIALLVVGAAVFFASGQSFEDFGGLDAQGG